MSIIPMGVIGSLLMLFFFHESFSFTATVGLIALTGIEIKNSLLLVDFANLLRSRGMVYMRRSARRGKCGSCRFSSPPPRPSAALSR